jgi:DNA-binding response OmpR family regulator
LAKISVRALIVNNLQSARVLKSSIISGLMNTTVLTIDDDADITELLSIILRSHGFDVITSNNSEEGLHLIREKSPDVVMLDLMMPDMNGWEMCKTIRLFSQVPIMVLSALSDPVLAAKVLDAGADDFIVKPVPSAVLTAHLNKLVRRSNPGKRKPEEEPNWLPGTSPLAS